MAITGLEDVQDTIDTIHEKALLTRQFEAIMSSLAWTIRKGKGHTTINVPQKKQGTIKRLKCWKILKPTTLLRKKFGGYMDNQQAKIEELDFISFK